MKSIALSGTTGQVRGLPFMNTTTAMRRVGLNCGNLVFQYAVTQMIDEPLNVVGQDIPWAPKHVHESSRVLVIPSANFLRENLDFSVFVDFLEKVDLPLVFIGLGAQAANFEKDQFDFHPSVLRLLDLLRERSEKVAIRGEFTARVLEKYGVTNYVVTGCPSNFINPSENFADMIEHKLAGEMRSFITHADEPWPKNKAKKQVERRLIDWTQSGRGIMVQQSVPRMITYLRQNNPFSTEDPGDHFEESLARTLMPDADIETFREFIALKLRTYYSVDQWIEDSSKFDFSIGLRLHGNMAAWQSGTPSLWITHDSRTRELVDIMALPNIGIDDFLENCETIQDAWERIEYDKVAYTARRVDLRGRVCDVLRQAGIKAVE